jgi:protein TonB
MFERSLVVSQRSHASAQQRWTTVASITFQVGIAAVVIAMPLFHQVMPMPKIEAPKAFVQLKPPKIMPVRVEARAASRAPAPSVPTLPQMQSMQLVAPSTIPTLINMTPDDAPPRIFTGGSKGMGTGVPQGLAEVADAASRVAVATHSDKPQAVSSGVLAGMLLAPIRPVYPAIAKAARVQGTVVVEAIISKAGRIESLNVVSGPMMLREAALAAIREARYQPYQLNGQPTDVQTTITVNFRMDG